MTKSLDESRRQIDDIDRRLIGLLAERMRRVREIAGHKGADETAPLRDGQRERELFDAWSRDAADAGLSGYYVGRILREVLNYSRRVQEGILDRRQDDSAVTTTRVGFQGVPGSYSHLAIRKLFASRPAAGLATEGFRTFTAAVDALETGEVDSVLLPIENTAAGSLNEVYRLLAERELHIVDEEVLSIDHCLAGLPGATLEGLRVVRSHPMALQQCQKLLSALGHCQAESFWDTAAAAETVAAEGDAGVAAICSVDCAEALGLVVLERGVADQRVNLTRFVLLARAPEAVDSRLPAKVSLLFTVVHRHGALAECLRILARRNINLTKLESRPKVDSPWEHLFYLDLEGNLADPALRDALEEFRHHTNHLKVLGCYPRRREEGEELWRPPDEGEAAGAAAPREEEAAPAPPARAPIERRREVRIGNVTVGGERFVLIAGPCAVESRTQIMEAAAMVKTSGARVMRGGAFKPRTSPYSFQGLGFPGLELLQDAARAYELPVVTEVLRSEDVEAIAERADAFQVGTRNMQNFELLKKLGTTAKPVLLKRGMSATLDELLAAVEYVRAGGNQQVILCERGIRTFETSTRATLDVSAVPVLKARTDLPVIVDPSHAAGDRRLVIPLALAAVAAGADGLLVEVHPDPESALCDKEQALTGDDLEALVRQVGAVLAAQGRSF